MLIFGHHLLSSEKLYHINSIEAIHNTPANSTLLFTYNDEVMELINFAKENMLNFAVDTNSLKEAIFCENLDAKYILVKQDISKKVQTAADNYVFDAKVLVHIQGEDEIENLVENAIDGVIFQEAIIKIS